MPSDIKYVKGKLTTTDEVEQIVQQIKVILGTKPGEVLGDPTFGFDLEECLFQFGVSKERILQQIRDQVFRYLVYNDAKWEIDFELNFGHDIDNHSDYAVLDILINQYKVSGIYVGQ